MFNTIAESHIMNQDEIESVLRSGRSEANREDVIHQGGTGLTLAKVKEARILLNRKVKVLASLQRSPILNPKYTLVVDTAGYEDLQSDIGIQDLGIPLTTVLDISIKIYTQGDLHDYSKYVAEADSEKYHTAFMYAYGATAPIRIRYED